MERKPMDWPGAVVIMVGFVALLLFAAWLVKS